MEASGEKKEKLSAGKSIEFSIRTIQNFGQTTFYRTFRSWRFIEIHSYSNLIDLGAY